MTTASAPAATSSTHRALIYRGPGEFLTLTARELTAALAAGRPVLAALPTSHLALLRDALDGEAHRVQWVDMSTEGRNPGRILPGVLTAFEAEHAGRPVTMVGEPIWPGRTPEEYAAALAHEALINLAFAGHPVDVLCPYDAAGLPADAVDDAGRTHPELLDRAGSRPSDRYEDPGAVAVEASSRLPEPPLDSVALQVNRLEDLAAVRGVLRAQAALAGLAAERADRFVLAAHEAVANALQHGGGRADVRLWRAGSDIVCQVRSSGGFGNLLAGRRAPHVSADHGRGLVMINEICDLVQLSATPEGATIQMRVSTGPA